MHGRKQQKPKNNSKSWKHLAKSEYNSKHLKNKRTRKAGESQKSCNHFEPHEYNDMQEKSKRIGGA